MATRPHLARPLAAAWVLACLLWLGARPPGRPPADPCAHPSERSAEWGWTTWVECNPENPPRPLRGAAPLLFGELLDLNRAGARLLEVLPGIGPRRAEAMVRERARRPFASLADVARVPGIGPVTAAGLRGWAKVGTEARRGARTDRKSASNCFRIHAKTATNGGPAGPGAEGGAPVTEASDGRVRPRELPGGGLYGSQGGLPSCD